jgi:ElaB/YqjD/DUF883 family membrane-anchored ribosome-binding protein
MNTPDPFYPQDPMASPPVQQAAAAAHSAMDTAREKLEAAGDVARQKLGAARDTARETMHIAREKVEHAGSNLLQWTRENPATALASVFATGLFIGCALAMTRHEKTFGERFSEDPMHTLREAVHSALAPLSERIHDAAGSARSAVGSAADSLHSNGHTWAKKLRGVGDNLKFW